MSLLLDSISAFIISIIAVFASLTPAQAVKTLWPFLLLEIPRYVLTELWIFWKAMKPEPSGKAHFAKQLAQELPLVSVLLPGYNECETLETTVLALREQSYPNLEIIVVSDGSTDGMDAVGRRLASKGWIRYFEHSIRGGKSSAANFALRAARGEYIVICDADSTFDTDSIWHLLVEFYRPEVVAVAGNIRVRNAYANLITRCQAMQYVLSIGVGRRVSSALDVLFIVSGAFGALRRSVLEASGGWDTGPGEDADLTIKARVAGGSIAFAPKAMCMTDAPDTWWAFFKQQMRWNRSTVRFRLLKYGWLLNPFHRGFKPMNLIGTIDIVVFQIVFAFTFPFYVTWLYITHTEIFWHLMTGVLMLYMLANFIHYFICLGLSERPGEDLKLFPYVPLYGPFMGLYLRFVRLLAYLDEIVFRRSYSEPYVPAYVQKQSKENDPW